MKVILSIHPEYVKKIIENEKKYEFRKKIFKKPVDEIIVYSTSPSKKIECMFEIEEIIEGAPQILWEKLHDEGGISKTDFFEYFSDVEKGYAIKIKNVKKINNPNVITNNKNFVAPQSFKYISDEEFNLIKD